jgi:streptogramin lyase
MKSLFVSFSLGSSLLVAAAALSGCATDAVFPNVTATTATTSLGHIQGNNYGGHAPIVGAHIFVLQADPAATGYYKAALDLLDSDSALTVEPAGTALAGHKYVQTNSYGDFDITGDYTCTAGYPVYLYAEGGNPSTNPNGSYLVNITGATTTKAADGNALVTFTTTGNQLLYQGESLTFGTVPAPYNAFSNTTQVVSPTNLTLTTFAVELGTYAGNPGTGTGWAVTASQVTPVVNNPAAVNLAVLGLCPSSGNFSYLNFVYVNEVSTAAAAYALGGFFPPPGTTGLAVAGASAANLSVPSGDALALTGLQNAALMAGQIYDVQGADRACTVTACDGDTHIARTTTPGILVVGTTTAGSPTMTNVANTAGLVVGEPISGTGLQTGETIKTVGTNTITLSTGTGVAAETASLFYAGAGNGTVPQALIDTIGNILANCVDSANTSGSASAQCTKLFSYALSAGTSGTTPVDTATAAIDIAHNPTANVSNLIGLPTGNVPFSPNLSSANDLSVGISYTPAHIGAPQGIAIDGSGNVWYTNASASSGYVTTLTPTGGVLFNVQRGIPTYIAIDGNGSAWFGDESNSSLYNINDAGTLVGPFDYGGLNQPYGIAIDGSYGAGYVYVDQVTVPQEIYRFNLNGQQAGINPVTGAASCLSGNGGLGWDADHLATDNNMNGFNLWFSSELGDFVCEVSSTGTLLRTVPINAGQNGSTYRPAALAIDSAGSVWVATETGNTMNKITQNGTRTTVTGGTLSTPFGVTVDGAGNVFVANRAGNGLTEYLASTGAPVSATNLYGGGSATIFSDPLNLAVDPSGFIWTTNYTGNKIVQILGVGAPTYTPLSVASYYNKLGSKP